MSGKVVHKLYWDFEREERWLNERRVRVGIWCATPGQVSVRDGEPGAWIYRIELLAGRSSQRASREYLSLLQDTGVEIVSTYVRWVYLRRRRLRDPSSSSPTSSRASPTTSACWGSSASCWQRWLPPPRVSS